MSGPLAALRRHPSGTLLGVQLVGVLAYPFFGESTLGHVALGVVGTLAVLAALVAVRFTPALTWVAVVVGVPAVGCSLLEAVWPDSDALPLASGLLHATFYFYVSYAMVRYVFADRRVTTDELFATGAAFTVVAWGFAYLFLAVQVIWPGSFIGASGPGDRTWFELLFASFANLTGVGLSDVVPVLPHARSLVMVEQVTGVMYVALVVARLVGLTTSVRDHPSP